MFFLRLLLLCLIPVTAFASDPTALYYYLALQIFCFVWPFLIPLPYLINAKAKLKCYFLMLLLPLAMLELVDIPVQIHYGLAAWGWVEFENFSSHYVFGRHVIAITLSLLLMHRFKRLINRTDRIAQPD